MIVTSIKELSKECKDASIFESGPIIAQLERELSLPGNNGIGLASNQVGINAKICIIRTREKLDLVNPKIIEKYDLMEFQNEGCLSFPEQWITTKRFNEILVKDALHPNGIVCTGLMAVATQHEISHLFGETMFDYEIKIPNKNEKCWCSSGIKYRDCHYGKVIRNG